MKSIGIKYRISRQTPVFKEACLILLMWPVVFICQIRATFVILFGDFIFTNSFEKHELGHDI